MTREEVLQAAAKCVNGDRQEDYGSPENNFGLVAAFWNAYLRPCMRPNIIGIDSKDVAAMLGLLKSLVSQRGTEKQITGSISQDMRPAVVSLSRWKKLHEVKEMNAHDFGRL